MDKPKFVDSLYGKSDLSHVEASDVLCEDFILDQHCHQITAGQKFHKHIKEGVVLERGV